MVIFAVCMSIKHFIDELGKGLRSPVYFLYAEDLYLLREAAMLTAKTVPEAERDFSFDVYDLDGIDEIPPFEQIIDVLNTIPFMGRQRVVVIENIQELKKKQIEPLAAYVLNPSAYSVLMLLHLGAPKAQFKAFMEKVKTITLDIRQQDLPLWIKEKARQRGFELTDDAMEYLIGATGPDPGLLSSELEKFALIGKNRISAQDIIGIVRGSSDYDVFDLVSALRDKDAGRVFKVARALRETHESYGLLGAVNWHYSRIASKDKSRTGYYNKVFELLNEADIRIKRSGGAFPLEYLLIRLLQV